MAQKLDLEGSHHHELYCRMFPLLSTTFDTRPAVGFVAEEPSPGAHTWTLTSFLGELLNGAENAYGPRDVTWTIVGIQFTPDGPDIWYPRAHEGRRHIVVNLSHSAREDLDRAIFQLAHEVIHLLSPSGGRIALRVEEGLATAYSHDVCELAGISYRSGMNSYVSAEADVRELLKIDPEAVRKAREIEPQMYRFSPDVLQQAVPDLPPELAQSLCQPFDRSA